MRFEEVINRVTLIERFESKFCPEPNSGCWLWCEGYTHSGYDAFWVAGRGSKHAHRAAWELYRPQIPKGICVLHWCDTRACVNPDHLFSGDRVENNADRDRKRRHISFKGEEHPNRKLSEIDVLAIREDPRVQWKIARAYGIDQTTVSDIKRRRNWRHI